MGLSKYNTFEVLDAMRAISEITELDFERVCRTNVSTWWGSVFDKMVKNGECQRKIENTFSGTYRGAEVLKPKQGFYHNLVVMDATSLYPSLAINCNLSFDTINCNCCKNNSNARISTTLDNQFLQDCKFIDANCWICKNEEGAFPKKLGLFKEERLKQKKFGNNSKQLAFKILLNSGYGVYGDSGFSYYDPRVAELITAYGRQVLSKMQEIANDLGFQVVYGDTDSLFLDSPPKESLSKFQDKFNRELDIELGIKNTYFNCILSKGKKHYIGYGVDDKNRKTFDIVGMEGKKSDRPKFVNSTFKQLVNDVVRDNVDPIPNLRRAMSDLDLNNVHQDLMKISKLLRENPEDYRSKTCQSTKIGNALGKTKGELIEYFVSNIKKTGSSWSTNPADIDVKWYKQSLWNTVKEVLEIAGYPVEDLANEFGVLSSKTKSSKRNGHGDAEPPRGVTG